MARSRVTNFTGRFEYLQATVEHWPELLRSLRGQVLALFRASLAAASAEAPKTYGDLCRRTSEEPGIEDVCTALEGWATSLGIRDRWLLNAAVETLSEWHSGGVENQWSYRPKELYAPFNPTFGNMWLPAVTSWPAFKEATDEHYRRELNKYRDAVARTWGAHTQTLAQQAIWTVLWQKGLSMGEIALRVRVRDGRRPSAENVHKQVRQFADSIGLTLRAAKHGPQKIT